MNGRNSFVSPMFREGPCICCAILQFQQPQKTVSVDTLKLATRILTQLPSKFSIKERVFTRPVQHSKKCTLLSCSHPCSFKTKETFSWQRTCQGRDNACSKSLLKGFGNKGEFVSSIKGVQLPADTVMRRTESVSHNLREISWWMPPKHEPTFHYSLTSLQMWLILPSLQYG
jgi:hypothetical protein